MAQPRGKLAGGDELAIVVGLAVNLLLPRRNGIRTWASAGQSLTGEKSSGRADDSLKASPPIKLPLFAANVTLDVAPWQF